MFSIDFQLPVLIVVIAINGFLALVVINNNSRSASNRIFGLLTGVITVWLLLNYLAIQPNPSAETTLWLERSTIFLAAPLSALFFLLGHTLPRPRLRLSRRNLLIVAASTLTVMAINLTPLSFAGIQTSADGSFSPIPGPGLALFSILSTYFSVSAVVHLRRNLKRAVSAERAKLRYVLAGISIMLALLILTILIPVAIFKSTIFVPFMPLYALAFLGLTTYAIVRHRLFDIRALVAKSIAYLLLLSTLAGLYAAAIFGISAVLFPNTAADLLEQGVYVALAVILAFTFQPIRRFFEKITDGIFFRDSYDSQVVLNNVSSILASELILDSLLEKSLAEICGHLRISSGRFVIYENDEIYKRSYYGPKPKLQADSNTMHKLRPGTLVGDEIGSGQRKTILNKYAIQVSMELWANEKVVGHLLLGDKLSGDMYSSQDLTLLEILRKEMAVAIVNAKAYEEIANFNATLQERITKATEHLSSANKKLKVLDKTKDDFISMASHQLGTPLTAVTGYLSMTLDEDKHNLTPAQHEYVTIALEASEQLVNMASDLLNVSRLNAGRFNIVRQPIDLVKLIQEQVRQLQPAADRKGLALDLELPEAAMPQISLDESKTSQVIMNFIDNAIYYTEKGSVNVSLEKTKTQIIFKVIDTGMGVPPEEKAKLFAKFYRAENAKSVRPDGTGLGLYLAKRVIEEQGGEIIFETVLGSGSTFGFKLPLVTGR